MPVCLSVCPSIRRKVVSTISMSQNIGDDVAMSDVEEQQYHGAAAEALAAAGDPAAGALVPADQLTLQQLSEIISKTGRDRAGDLLTPLTQITRIYSLHNVAVSQLLKKVPDYLQHRHTKATQPHSMSEGW